MMFRPSRFAPYIGAMVSFACDPQPEFVGDPPMKESAPSALPVEAPVATPPAAPAPDPLEDATVAELAQALRSRKVEVADQLFAVDSPADVLLLRDPGRSPAETVMPMSPTPLAPPLPALADVATPKLREALSLKLEGVHAFDGQSIAKSIYWPDDRKDLHQLPAGSKYRSIASATVALIHSSDIRRKQDRWAARTESLARARGLCHDERFADQPVASFCSGVLVAPRVVATAAHCVSLGGGDPQEIAFVFGFAVDAAGAARTTFDGEDVFFGGRVIAKDEAKNGDWALIELDRPVERHAPAKLRRAGRAGEDEAVYVIGHPAGLPLKVADGSTIRDDRDDRLFVANLDAFGGNSGSPVYGPTDEVEGLLIRGDADFVPDGDCNRAYVCPTTGCRGEVVTRIANLLAKIPN
jgi:V8-like Glu-specific endopeptidase